MRSTKSVSPQRRLARLAIAGAFAAIPLAALAAPAAADITLEPEITEVARPHHNNNDNYPWLNQNPWDNNRNHHDNNRNHWDDDDCDRRDRGHDHDRNFPRNVLPRGSFGSS